MQSIPRQALFLVETIIVVNDADTGRTCIRGSTTFPLGEFQLDLKQEWLDATYKYAELPSNTYEEFEECFIIQSEEIKNKIIDGILSYPRFDHHDGLQEIIGSSLSICRDEVESVCTYLKISERVFYDVFIQPDGFVIDRVFPPMDIVECLRNYKLGKIDKDEFSVALSEASIEFEVQCHMVFNLMLDNQLLINALYQSDLCGRLDTQEAEDSEGMLDKLISKLVDRLTYLKSSTY